MTDHGDDTTHGGTPVDTERRCRNCGNVMTGSRSAEPDQLRHVSRELCSQCYYPIRRAGRLDEFPRIQHDADALVAAFDAARRGCSTISQEAVADSLGVPRTTLAMALRRRRSAMAPPTKEDTTA